MHLILYAAIQNHAMKLDAIMRTKLISILRHILHENFRLETSNLTFMDRRSCLFRSFGARINFNTMTPIVLE